MRALIGKVIVLLQTILSAVEIKAWDVAEVAVNRLPMATDRIRDYIRQRSREEPDPILDIRQSLRQEKLDQ